MSTELPMSAPPRPLPMAPGDDPVRAGVPALDPAEHQALVAEVRDLARGRDAVILAHNYQLPEVQDVADVVGDSLGLSIEAAKTDASTIVFCGVHFMAESASVLSPEKTVLIPDVDAGCSLADSITAEQLAAWQARHPGAITVMYVNTTAAVKALTDYCVTSSNAVPVVEQVYREHGEDVEILFGPDMFLGSFVAKRIKEARGVDRLPGFHVWDGECHVHAGIKPGDIERVRDEHPDADFLIHPECGCSTSVMEYVASGDVDTEGVHMLSTGGMLDYATARGGEGGTPGGGPQRTDDAAFTEGEARSADAAAPGPGAGRPVTIVATETGMLHPLREAAPGVDFVPANVHASCGYMKMITLRKLRDTLRDGTGLVKVPDDVAERARRPIERMVAIGRDADAPLGGE